MNKTIIIILVALLIMPFASAEDINTVLDEDDFGQVDIDVKDTYLINDTMKLNSTIKINTKIDKKQYVHSFIDGRNIETEANSGGYVEAYNRYILPHDLGLGFHTLQFLVEEDGRYIGKATYNFAIAKSENDDLEKYRGFTPYYYEDGFEDIVEDDYNDFVELASIRNISPAMIDSGEHSFSEPIQIKVNLGIIGNIDDSLTSEKIESGV